MLEFLQALSRAAVFQTAAGAARGVRVSLPRRESRRVTGYFARRNRRALKITEAELRLMASAAIMGDSSQPVIG